MVTRRVLLLEQEIINLRKSYDEIFSILRSIFTFLQYTDEDALVERGLELFGKVFPVKDRAVYFFDENGTLLEEAKFSTSKDVEEKFQGLKSEGIVEWVMDNDSPFPVEEDGGVCMLVPLSFRMKAVAIVVLIADINMEELTEQMLSQINMIRYGLAANIANIRLYNEVVRMRDYLYNILENLTNGVVVVDRGGKLFLVNRVAEELLSFEASEVEGNSFFALFPEGISAMLVSALVDAASSGDAVMNEFELNSQDGRMLFIAFSCKFLERFNSFLFVFRDITESKEVERIRELDGLKNQFISNVSHDLRTPLTGIKAFTEILLEGIEDMSIEEIKDGLTTVKDEADRLTEIVNDLLDFSRIESKMMELELDEVELVSLWKDVIRSAEVRIKKKNIKLQTDFPQGPLLFNGDRKKLHRVLLNLLDNAVKYNVEGGKIWISAGRDGEFIWFEIGNTGYTIAEEDLPHIFDSFYVGRLKINISDERSGIGLAIVKRVIEAHGGTISVRSSEEEGTVFTVRIPIKEMAVDDKERG